MSIQYNESIAADLHKIDGLTLTFLTADEALLQSVTTGGIDNLDTYKPNGDPETNGINDDRMGTMAQELRCKTCVGGQVDCPGHFGHIALAKPVYHANMLDYIRKVLRCVCFGCGNLLASDPIYKDELESKQKLKTMKSRFEAVVRMSNNIKNCCVCQKINHKYSRGPLRIDYTIEDEEEYTRLALNDKKQTLWPEDAKRILSMISPEHLQKMGLHHERSHPKNMIIETLAVAPPPVRPSVQMTNSMRSEDDLTVAYKSIVKQNKEI